jgi:tellurium resistance protein TerD
VTTKPGITKTTVGLGWNPRVTDGQAFDLDAIAFLVGENGKVRADTDFIFFNNLTSSDGSVKHNGDNRTGEGAGDDETLSVDLSKVPADVSKVIFAVTIYDGQTRNQNFGQVGKAGRVFQVTPQRIAVRSPGGSHAQPNEKCQTNR